MTQFSNSISYITLGVDDLERSLRFYRERLRLSNERELLARNIIHGAVVFFDFSARLATCLVAT